MCWSAAVHVAAELIASVTAINQPSNALRFGRLMDLSDALLIEARVLLAGSLFYFCLNSLRLFVCEQQSPRQCLLHLSASPLRLHHSRTGVTVRPKQ